MTQQKIDRWLKNYIYMQVLNEEYIDNLRWADINNPQELVVYQAAKDLGCCGFFDGEVKAPDGKTYKVGCNYGH